jgi:hypothetical protein
MVKFYVDSIIQHPLTGEPDHEIIEVIADVPELEKVLFSDRRSKQCGEGRSVLYIKQLGVDTNA